MHFFVTIFKLTSFMHLKKNLEMNNHGQVFFFTFLFLMRLPRLEEECFLQFKTFLLQDKWSKEKTGVSTITL